MAKESFYLTTTIPYVNADPHIGFALEVVQADVLARHKRMMNYDVFFNAGTDEHGQKIWEGAQKEGVDVQAYVDRFATAVKNLKEPLNLSYDNFIRTTDENHKLAAQEMWRRCEASGDIYKKTFKGLYCVGCEKFLVERDLIDGECQFHPGKKPVELEEENYFFKLSNYQSFLKDYLSSDKVIIPEHRLKEAQKFVEDGLEDFSISREKSRLPWGIPVPGDDNQVMYVWFDALTNYISTLGWPNDDEGKFNSFWEKGFVVQTAGKDQIRFQSIMWQAMLKSAGVKNTDQFFYHGFINSGGQRMSKSLGNIVNPVELVNEFGTDALRYFLLREIHPYDDSDYTRERYIETYNANLANGLGNLASRILKMSESYLDSPVECPEHQIEDEKEHCELIDSYNFSGAMDKIWKEISEIDQHIQKTEPFKKIKVDEEGAKEDVRHLVHGLWHVAFLLEPFLPETSQKIKEAIRVNKKPETLFERK